MEDYSTSKDSVRIEIRKAKSTMDSVRVAMLEIKPLINGLREFHDVGIKVHKQSGRMFYVAPDGEDYRALYDENKDQYYYIDFNQKSRWCE